MRRFFWLVMALLLVGHVQAAVIGISPSLAYFSKMVKGGYAERQFLLTTNSEQNVTGTVDFEGDIATWMSVDPESLTFSVSYASPYSFKLIIRPPADAQNGNYSGIMRLTSAPLGGVSSGAGSAVIAAVAVRVHIEIIGDEIIACRAGALQVTSTEIAEPYTFSAIVYNDGNVRIRPEIVMNIYAQNGITLLDTKNFLGSQVLPTTNSRITKDIENDLEIGQYFVDILVKECGYSYTTTFDVVERGGIIDKGTLIAIRANEYSVVQEPTPIVPVFRNEGPRKVFAKFKGEIRDMKTNKVVMAIDTEELEVLPNQVMEFPFFFVPENAGDYLVSGRMVYNSKVTFEEKSKKIEVIGSGRLSLGKVFLVLLYLIIGLVILIILGKIRKERKHKHKKIRW